MLCTKSDVVGGKLVGCKCRATKMDYSEGMVGHPRCRKHASKDAVKLNRKFMRKQRSLPSGTP